MRASEVLYTECQMRNLEMWVQIFVWPWKFTEGGNGESINIMCTLKIALGSPEATWWNIATTWTQSWRKTFEKWNTTFKLSGKSGWLLRNEPLPFRKLPNKIFDKLLSSILEVLVTGLELLGPAFALYFSFLSLVILWGFKLYLWIYSSKYVQMEFQV